MSKRLSPRLVAALQAWFVTFLWSTSVIMIKIGVEDLPPLTFVGLRNTVAALTLLPFALQPARREKLRTLPRAVWWRLLGLGFFQYVMVQGAFFTSLSYLPANTASLLFNLTTIVVALGSIIFLAERPTLLQWGGIVLFFSGLGVYFYPLALPAEQAKGFLAIAVAVIGGSVGSVLGRAINRSDDIGPLLVSTVSIGLSAILLLGTGLLTQGLPPLQLRHVLFIIWMGALNVGFGFILWNHTLRTLTAVESSVINNLLFVQVAVLSWIILGERINARQMMGMALALAGGIMVQVRGGAVDIHDK